jgi:hypothetical protein
VFSQGEKAEMCNANADSVLRSIFAGGRIRKTETNVFEKFFGIRASAPQEGAGGMRGGSFGIFGGGAYEKEKELLKFSNSLVKTSFNFFVTLLLC